MMGAHAAISPIVKAKFKCPTCSHVQMSHFDHPGFLKPQPRRGIHSKSFGLVLYHCCLQDRDLGATISSMNRLLDRLL